MNGPHQAIILIKYEMYEKLSDGRASGRPVDRGSTVLSVEGKDFEECKENLNNMLDEMKVKIPTRDKKNE